MKDTLVLHGVTAVSSYLVMGEDRLGTGREKSRKNVRAKVIIVRKKETAVGEDQEHRKLAEKEHELARNQTIAVRKQEPQQNTPRVGEGKYKD